MNLFPEFSMEASFIEPWSSASQVRWSLEVIVMGTLVSWSCGLIGSFIVVRRMALMGDAISHGILPGLVIAFLLGGSFSVAPMLLGACIAGLACSFCIEWLRHHTTIRQDAAMALVFTSFFALGVTLINLQGGHLDIDAGCILYGEIGLTPLAPEMQVLGLELGNRAIWTMGVVTAIVSMVVIFFYKQLLLASFDPTLAQSSGWPIRKIQMAIMLLLALTTVASLEAVGVILVVAMLIFPCVTASFFCVRLSSILIFTFPLGLLYSIGGFHLAQWLDCSIAAAMAVAATCVFIVAFLFGTQDGCLLRFLKNSRGSASAQ